PGHPLRLVASDTWLGGNIAIHQKPAAQVFVNASYADSPWLSPDHALDCGVLVVYKKRDPAKQQELAMRQQQSDDPPWDAALLRLYDQASWKGEDSLHWSSEKSPVINLVWGIIPPGPACAK